MRTAYDSPGYAARFALSRPLDDGAVQRWSRVLREAAGASVHTVLDLGAGTGRFWPAFFDAWPSAHIDAVDSSTAMLAAAPTDTRVRTIALDIDAISQELSAPDVVFCSMAMHYSADPAALCSAIRGMLRPGGTLIVRTSSRETAASSVLFRFYPSARRAQASAFPAEQVIVGWLESAGFVTRTEHVGTPAAASHRALVASCLGRGLPAFQSVRWFEFVVGSSRLIAWSLWQAALRRPVAADDVLVVMGGPV